MLNSVSSGKSQVAALVDEVLVAAALNQIHFSPLQMTQVLLFGLHQLHRNAHIDLAHFSN